MTGHRTPKQIQSRSRIPVGHRDRLLKTFAASLLTRLALHAAKAFPIAFWTPDATGAMTAAVIPSVIHDSLTKVNYRKARKLCQAKVEAKTNLWSEKVKSGERHERQLAAILLQDGTARSEVKLDRELHLPGRIDRTW